MRRTFAYLRAVLLATALAAPVASTGCAVRARVYDPYYHDYHRWDGGEQRSYREYWEGRHENYHNYSKLSDRQKQQYWDWRHHRADADRH